MHQPKAYGQRHNAKVTLVEHLKNVQCGRLTVAQQSRLMEVIQTACYSQSRSILIRAERIRTW